MAARSWIATGSDREGWAELLSASPTIIHTLPSGGSPLGAASHIGPTFKHRPVHFLIMPSWTIERPRASQQFAGIASLYLSDHLKHRITFLCNTDKETEMMTHEGCEALTINQNCLVNDEIFRPLLDVKPIYRAVYNARLSDSKRPELASDIEKLALIYFYASYDGSVADFHAAHARYREIMPHAHFLNALTPDGCRKLSWAEVNEVLAQSRVGLCLSSMEGAMRAAIEYLFAGLPVVSTPSIGGRDYFFDPEFCVIADPDPRSIREAVHALAARNFPRDYVRARTLTRVNRERDRYIEFVQGLIDQQGGELRFADRFWQCTRGKTIMHWRSMKEFSETVRQPSERIWRKFPLPHSLLNVLPKQ
jgi:glycosyltransferase involved in cell wall biosynthesis